MACDLPELYEFPSLDSCQKRFLWNYREVDCAPQPGVYLVLQAGDGEKFPKALGIESVDPLQSASRISVSQATEEDGGDMRLVQLERRVGWALAVR